MPTPARAARAEIGASGSARNTSRAAARIRPSLRAAWARRPLRGALTRPEYQWNEPFRSVTLNGTDHSVQEGADMTSATHTGWIVLDQSLDALQSVTSRVT